MHELISWVLEQLGKVDWTTVIVAIVTGLVAAGGSSRASRIMAKQEHISVRAALIAEVSALLDLVEMRGFLAGLRNQQAIAADALKRGSPRLTTYQVDVRENFNQVYQANLSRLGVLNPEEAGQIVQFYQLLDAVRLDVSVDGQLARGTVDPAKFEEAADLLELAMVIGKRLKTKRLRNGLATGR